MKSEQIKNIAYWTTTILGPASFVIGGVLNLTQTEQVVATMNHLGYPAYFASILGLWKLLGAVAVVIPRFPRLKEWAYAGATFTWVMAIIAAYGAGEGAQVWSLPPALLGLLIVSYVTRPASRRVMPFPSTG